jgi:hypothetical protein
MSTQFHWSSKRYKAALALAEGQSQQTVAEAIGVCRKTICNWLCVREFAVEVHRLSCMIDISSRAERLRHINARCQAEGSHDGRLVSYKDLLDWLKFAQSETIGIKLGLSTMDPTEIDGSIEAAWQQSVEEEVNRRLAERELTLEVRQSNGNGRQGRNSRESLILTPGVNR